MATADRNGPGVIYLGPDGDELGAFPRSGCFHVARTAADTYHFVIDDVVYPHSLGAGHVAIIARAVGFGDLHPRPVRLPRAPRLEFTAGGDAEGAFELFLILVDGAGRAGTSSKLTVICDTKSGGH